MLRVWLIGRIAVEWNGTALTLPGANRVRALVGYLALHPGPQPRADLATALWTGVPHDAARAGLRTALWSLGRAWEPHTHSLVGAGRSAIGLLPSEIWVDAMAEDPGDGRLLPGVDDDWVAAAREALDRARIAALDELIGRARAEGRTAGAVQAARRRAVLAPLDEPAHRTLVSPLTASGDRAGAARASRDFAKALRDELGIAPSAATRAVHAGARTGRPQPTRRRLFGRAREIAALDSQWRLAADGAGRVVVLTGEAGIGKTSLIGELSHRVGAAGGRRAVGSGIDVGGETPFATWLELAGRLVSTLAPPAAAALWPTELNRLSPSLGARLGRVTPPPIVASPQLERLRVFEAVLSLVEYACADRPLLIAVDDVHRSDAVSMRLTAHIGRRIRNVPVMLVLARRDRPANPAVDMLLADLVSRQVPIVDVDLGPVADAEVAAIAHAVVGHQIDERLMDSVIAAAEGNPLLAEETARSAVAGGGTPANLRTAVRATVRGLSSGARDLVELLAVVGRPLRPAELARLGSVGTESAIAAAIDSGLVVDDPGGLGFRHALLREAVYGDLDGVPRRHERVATALAGGDPVELATHLVAAGRSAEAAAAWSEAAERARAVGALPAAIDFLTRATDLDPNSGRWWELLADVTAWSGQQDEMAAAWSRALELLPEDELADAWNRHGRRLRTVICKPGASLDAYRHSERYLTSGSSPSVRAATLIGRAWGEAVAGDAGVVDDLLDRARTFLPDEPGDEVLSDIGEIRLLGLVRRGRFAEGGEMAWTAAASAAKALRPDRGFAVWLQGACALTCAGNFDGALDLADRAIASTRSVPVLLSGCLAAKAHLLARTGRFDEAAVCIDQQLECAERLDDPRYLDTARIDAGLVALASGRYEDAAKLLQQGLAGDPQASRPSAALARAEALVAAGAPLAARAQLRLMVTEPAGRADQPWALVPKVARVQGLIAAAEGDKVIGAQAVRRGRNGLAPGSGLGHRSDRGRIPFRPGRSRPPAGGRPGRTGTRVAAIGGRASPS